MAWHISGNKPFPDTPLWDINASHGSKVLKKSNYIFHFYIIPALLTFITKEEQYQIICYKMSAN